ncbi:MAG: hypothetical protein ABI333_11280 [bacterium]
MTDSRDKLDLALSEAYRLARRIPTLPDPSDTDPDDEVLLLVLDGAQHFPQGEVKALRERVESSPFSSERLAVLSEVLTEVHDQHPEPMNRLGTPVESQRDPVRLSFVWARGCLRYLWGTLEPRSLIAVPVATRGEAVTGPREETSFFDFAHHFAGIDVVIQVERVRDDLLDVQLNFDGAAQQLAQLRVTLALKGGSLLDSQPVEHGRTRFAALQPLAHEIQITSARKPLGRVLLDVHAER